MAKNNNIEVDLMMSHIERDDLDSFETLMLHCREKYEPLTLVDDIITPLMYRVGDYWYENRINVYQEHFVSQVIMSLMSTVRSRLPKSAEHVLLANPTGEAHSLGLVLVAYALGTADAHCTNLGANLPFEELLKAIDSYKPDILCLSFSQHADTQASSDYLAAVATAVLPDLKVWIGGTGVPDMDAIPSGVIAFSSASQAYRELLRLRETC